MHQQALHGLHNKVTHNLFLLGQKEINTSDQKYQSRIRSKFKLALASETAPVKNQNPAAGNRDKTGAVVIIPPSGKGYRC